MRSELRLFIFISINVLALMAGWRLSRRRATLDVPQQILDMLLAWYVMQYLAVAICGVLGVLAPASLIVAVLFLSAIAWVSAGPPPNPVGSKSENYGFIAATAFIVAFLVAAIYSLSLAPVLSTDGLAYHLPMVVRWMQAGRLEEIPGWYWNPGNTYAPESAGTFIAWLMVPLRSDVLARFVQVIPLLAIFFGVVQVARAAGVNAGLAALVAVAAVLARPLFSQSLIVKDDLFVVAFFITAAAACVGSASGDSLSPLRIGAAVGLIMASKYTALLTLPVLLLVVDGPHRAGWRRRQWLWAAIIAIGLAGPWYVRNFIQTRNPLYPLEVKIAGLLILPGLFTVATDARLHSPGGILEMLTEGYYGLPKSLGVLMVFGGLGALCLFRKRMWREPAVRFSVLGTPLGLIIFIIASPHPEVRYFFPFYLPLFMCCAMALSALRPVCLGWVGGVAVMALSAVTAFAAFQWKTTLTFSIFSAAVAGAAVGIFILWRNRVIPRFWLWSATGLCLTVFTMLVYVHWNAYLTHCQESADAFWQEEYGPLTDAWTFVRDPANLPRDATVAYANTYLLYPLYGPHYERKVIYAPVRPDLNAFTDLPSLGEKLDGYELVRIVTRAMSTGANLDAWRDHLRKSGAKYLFVEKDQILTDPPEWRFAREDVSEFKAVFENTAVVIYRIELRS